MRLPARRTTALLVVVVLALAGGAAFWVARDDDPRAAYCELVEERREAVGAALAAGETSGLIRALPTFEELAAEAPDDLRDEWAIVVERISALRDALDEAGVEPAAYDPEAPPEDVTEDQRKAIRAAAVRLGAQETVLALAGVQQHARDVCKTPLSL